MKNRILFGLVVSVFVFTFTLCPPQPLVRADHVHEEDNDEQEVIILTNDLLVQVKMLIRAQANNHDRVAQMIKKQILKRKEHILKLLEKHPERAMKYLLPADAVSQFPDEIQELLESDVEMAGEITTTIAHLNNGSSKVFYSLKDPKNRNKNINLHFNKKVPLFKSGSIVKIKGKKIDDQNIALEANGTNNVQTVLVASADVSGEQKTIVIPINFQDSALPCSDSNLQSFFFSASDSIKNYYAESSFNKINVTGVVSPRVTIPYKSTDACNYSSWSTAADNALTSQGFSLSGYTRKIYQFPSSSCGYIGLGTIGGNPSRSWVFRCDIVDVTAHEFGHNLGWHHASTGTLNSEGDEYGDMSCIMGYSAVGLRHANAVHKIESGWIPSSRVTTITNSGTYTIYKSEDGNTTSAQVLKIRKNDTNEDYYVSFRSSMGFDTSLSSSYSNKVSVHRWNGISGTKTYLLSVLSNGQTFSDPTNNITIQMLSHDSNVAVLSVNVGGSLPPPPPPPPVCTRSAPLVNLSPLSQTASRGQSLNYTLSVTNQDSSECSNATFSLRKTIPSGWSSSFSPTSLTLAPSATGTVTFKVTSKSTAADGTYTVKAKVSNASDLNKNATAEATYIVFSDAATPEVSITAPFDGQTILSNFSIKATATDDLKVTKVEFYIDDVFVSKDSFSPYTYTWYIKRFPYGTHKITVKAYDAKNHVGTASVFVTTAVATKSK